LVAFVSTPLLSYILYLKNSNRLLAIRVYSLFVRGNEETEPWVNI
jgi:hypothetical protein